MVYITKQEILDEVVAYKAKMEELERECEKKNPIGKNIKLAEKAHDANLIYVKYDIGGKYGKKLASRYYPEFGIKKQNKAFLLKGTQDGRLDSLYKLVAAIDAHGFTKNPHGTKFWQPLLTKYQALVSQAAETTGNIAALSDEKNVLRAQLEQHLTAIKGVVKANNPKNYEAIWRKLGFHKERH